MEFEQRKREVKLAVKLRDRLQAYVEGNEQQRKEWREAMMRKARELCKNSFGDALVEAIGWMYENYASQFLGETLKEASRRKAFFYCPSREA